MCGSVPARSVQLLMLFVAAGCCGAQDFTQRGFLELGGYFYPQRAPNDSGRAIGEGVLNYEASYRPNRALTLAGSIEAQTDTHRQVERSLHVSWLDRELLRPAIAVRRLSLAYHKGLLNLELGKQSVRWGKADILNPTDRFTPRDFLNVVRNEYLPVTAVRANYGGQANALEVVAVPLFTPSRMPLLNQRWGALPPGYVLLDLPSRFPGGTQFGGRWNHIGQRIEYSLSYFQGFNHQPLLEGSVEPAVPPVVAVRRYYPRLRSYGADFASPFRFATVKGEAAYFDSRDPAAARYLLYVWQLERQWGEWSFVGGYAGEVVTRPSTAPSFDYERGVARCFLGRASYTISTNQSVAAEVAVRQNGQGALVRTEYSQALGQHWRATAGVAVIRGSEGDFFGQFHRNSYGLLILRYSF